MSEITLYTDGGARGNPGPAGYGFVAFDTSTQSDSEIILRKCGNYLGTMTNNQAEYEGLLQALIWADKQYPDSQLKIFMDSLLIVNQIKGSFKVKNKQLLPKYQQIMTLLRRFPSYSITHVKREKNHIADSLANLAMDTRSSVEE